MHGFCVIPDLSSGLARIRCFWGYRPSDLIDLSGEPLSAEGMFYNKEKDFHVCPMRQHIERIAEQLASEEGVRHRADDVLSRSLSSDKSNIIWHTVVSVILERPRLPWTFPSRQSYSTSKNYAECF